MISNYLNATVDFGIVVDTNLLLLYLVGTIDPDRIARFKNTRMFAEEDFEALLLILNEFPSITVTPNILTEVNSFLNQLPNAQKASYYAALAVSISLWDELYLPSTDLSARPEFTVIGLTDAGISALAGKNYLVLTVDSRLADFLQRQGLAAINFNHFRNYI